MDQPSRARQPTAPPSTDRHWRRVLYTMWLAMFFVFLEWTFAMTFLPVFLQQDLGLSFHRAASWTGLMMALPSLAMFFAQPLWGLHADRHGRKRVVIISVVFTSLLRALWAFAHSPLTLLILAVSAGILGAGVVVGQALVASAVPRERMGEAMGTLQMSTAMGFLVGPVVGQACAGLFGPRPTFLLQAAFALIGAITVLLFVPEHFRKPEQAGPANLVEVFTRDLRPLVGNRQLQSLWVTAFVVFFGWSAMWPVMTYYVQFIGVPLTRVAAYAAYVMLATGSLQAVLAPLYGRTGDRIGQKPVLVATMLACGLFLLPHALVRSYAQFFGLRLLATGAGAAVNPTTGALVARSMPRERYGGAYGVLSSARSLAGAVGPIIGGSLASLACIRYVFVWTGVLTLTAALWAQWAVQEPAPAPERPHSATDTGPPARPT